LLLRQTELPITEIAVACGFTSASHFSRTYRSRFGYSPKSERLTNRSISFFRRSFHAAVNAQLANQDRVGLD
jgi:AraC-like DNA-binding protein